MFPTPKITTADIERAESRDKTYKLGVGHGLYVQIEPTGAKYWRFKYRFLCREKRLSFGVFPEISLEQALEQTEAARALLKAGKDPSAVRQEVAKQRGKAQSMKSAFRIDLSDQGCLTIETERHVIALSPAQTDDDYLNSVRADDPSEVVLDNVPQNIDHTLSDEKVA